jgi:hypothetical protein
MIFTNAESDWTPDTEAVVLPISEDMLEEDMRHYVPPGTEGMKYFLAVEFLERWLKNNKQASLTQACERLIYYAKYDA